LLRREQIPDRNTTLFEVEVIQSETNYDFPLTNFTYISSKEKIPFSSFNEDAISTWFTRRKAMTSMKAGRALAIRKFIKCIQIHTLQDENSVICVKALCAAAASKNVDYIPKIMIDGTGRRILQANCTCPAGSGWSAACRVGEIDYCLNRKSIISGRLLEKS